MFSRTRTRVAAVAATSVLALGASAIGAGAANAVTNDHAVDGNDVSVTFALESGELAGNCYAALVPTAIAPQFLEVISGGLDAGKALALFTRDDVTTLNSDLTGLPTIALTALVRPSASMSAKDVPSNVYTLATYCLGDGSPGVNPGVVIGNPIEAGLGSIQAGSSGENLAAASASLPMLLGLLSGGGLGELAGGS